MTDLYRAGAEPADIAERLEIDRRTVYRHLEAAGLEVTRPDDWRRRPRRPAP